MKTKQREKPLAKLIGDIMNSMLDDIQDLEKRVKKLEKNRGVR